VKINLLSVGTRMPAWVNEGVEEYRRRLPVDFGLACVEVALAARGKNADIARLRRREGEALMARVPRGDFLVAMEVGGRSLSTEALAEQLSTLRMEGRNLTLLVGGPDGLDDACVTKADEKWSLSALTLPHPLVRIVLAEQIYRAWTLLVGHPYHRG
jgi:23S rRNA (pseudouridine1915-N3)-methyltransferase